VPGLRARGRGNCAFPRASAIGPRRALDQAQPNAASRADEGDAMSARADFQVFTFNEHLGDDQSDIDTDFTFRGEFSSKKTFHINQTPFQVDGFVQYHVSHVDELGHEILINDVPLPAVDVFRTGQGEHTGHQAHMDVIPASCLRKGPNTIQFQRKGGDDFLIHTVVVHWRELDPA
jgi:hypothetical protein